MRSALFMFVGRIMMDLGVFPAIAQIGFIAVDTPPTVHPEISQTPGPAFRRARGSWESPGGIVHQVIDRMIERHFDQGMIGKQPAPARDGSIRPSRNCRRRGGTRPARNHWRRVTRSLSLKCTLPCPVMWRNGTLHRSSELRVTTFSTGGHLRAVRFVIAFAGWEGSMDSRTSRRRLRSGAARWSAAASDSPVATDVAMENEQQRREHDSAGSRYGTLGRVPVTWEPSYAFNIEGLSGLWLHY